MANSDSHMKDLLKTALEDSGLLFEDILGGNDLNQVQMGFEDLGQTTANSFPSKKPLITRLYSPSIEVEHKNSASPKTLNFLQPIKLVSSNDVTKISNASLASSHLNLTPKISLLRLPTTSGFLMNKISDGASLPSKTNIINLAHTLKSQLNKNTNINTELKHYTSTSPDIEIIEDDSYVPERKLLNQNAPINFTATSHNFLHNIQSPASYSNQAMMNKAINSSIYNYNGTTTTTLSLADRFELFLQNKTPNNNQLFSNQMFSTNHQLFGPVPPSEQPHPLGGDREGVTEEEMAELEDQLRHVETYAEYMPKKLRYGCRHPDSVVETNSLSSVEPPGIWYSISLPETVIDTCALSALQLEAIIYACQQHEILLPDGSRAGFLIGDGPGVGKGRTIAGIICENYLLRRKRAIWLSVSNDLKYDAERDLKDIDAGKISVASLNKFKYKKISSKSNGSFKKGIIFATYSSLIGESQRKGKYNTRMRQLLKWCGKNFDGVIIFDECHKAKNLVPSGSSKPTKTGLAVLELQNRLPKARVVYASATGATEPKNMAYMVRLGIWGRGTPFKEFQDFIQAVERRGVGAMELVAMDMKLRGTYMARQLSFAGVSFIVKEAKLNQNIIEIYDASVELWAKARDKFQLAFDLVENGESISRKQVWSQFWAAHQRFFKYLCLAAKVSMCIALAKQALKDGKCVVIGLQTTGEARTLEHIEDCGGEIFDFISTAKGVLQSLIEKHFPSSSGEGSGHKSTTPWALDNIMRLRGLTAYNPSVSAGVERPKDQPKPSRWILDSVAKTCGESGGTSLKQKIVDVFAPGPSFRASPSHHSSGLGGEEVKGGSPSVTSSSENDEDDDNEVTSDEEDGEEEEGTDEDRNPFDDGDEDEDEEAPWLARKRKKRPKPCRDKKKAKQNDATSPSLSTPSTTFQDGAGIKPDTSDPSQPGSTTSNLLPPTNNEPVRSENEVVDNKQNTSEGAITYGYNGVTLPSTSCISNTKDSVKLMRHELLAEIEELGDRLPPNTLDQLIEELGGPDQVAEMTGRKGRVITLPDGSIGYQTRGEIDVPLEALNVKEKQRFMDGIKKIAIISEAASSGISLQSDRRVINQLRRVHITLELPWSADKAVQQFGRTHRSNQVSAPEYIFLISELAGERRFASIVAKRLESLGALTHGDRRATETRDLSQFNFDNKYGRMALDSVMRSILTPSVAFVEPPSDYGKNFFNDAREGLIAVGMIIKEHQGGYTLDKDYSNIVKFLNRLLGLKVKLQNALFQYFTDTLNAYILDAKRTGKWDMGILDFGTSGDSVIPLRKQTFHFHTSRGVVSTQLWCFQVQRGLPWDAATKLYREQQDLEDGFFVSKQVKNGIYVPILALSHASRKNAGGPSDSQKGDNKLFNIYRPNTGLQGKMETLANLMKKYRKVPPQEAESHWNAIFTSSLNQCSHVLWKGSCKKANSGLFCDIGIRTRKYYVLAGSVLSVWNCLEELFSFLPGGGISKMQIIRVKTKNDQRIIGVWVRANYVPPLVKILSRESNKTDCEDFLEEIL